MSASSLPLSIDNNAAWPVAPAAWEAYVQACNEFADPRAPHSAGQDARASLTALKQNIADLLGVAANQLYFSSGGTEGDALALQLATRSKSAPHVVSSSIEHAAVIKNLRALEQQKRIRLSIVSALPDGTVDPHAFANAIETDTALVSLVAACNETGVLQPITEVAALCHQRGVLLHTDGVQLPARADFHLAQLNADFVSLSAHKFGAVGGIGVLYARDPNMLPHTVPASLPNLPGLAALRAALAVLPTREELNDVAAMRDTFEARLQAALPNIFILGQAAKRLTNTSCIRFSKCEGDGLMMMLDLKGYAVSTGSACSSGSIDPSPILMGMGLSAQQARECLRFSFRNTLDTHSFDKFVSAVIDVVQRMRAII